MPLIEPEQFAHMASNGLSPDHNHKPVVLLQAKHRGEPIMQFLLTHVDPEYPDRAFGLIDFGTGKPRRTMIFIQQLENPNPNYDMQIEQVNGFVAEYPIDVYEKAAHMLGKITQNKPALQMAANHLKLQMARDNFTKPIKGDVAFMPTEPGF